LQGHCPDKDPERRLDDICERDMSLLETEGMVINTDGKLRLTAFGSAMARYYIKMNTMRLIMKMLPKAKLSDVVTMCSSASAYISLMRYPAHSSVRSRRIQRVAVSGRGKEPLQGTE
jgi:replicative superfamily II helicase